MMKRILLPVVLCGALLAGGCSNLTREEQTTLTGGAIGAAGGAAISALAGGNAGIGALIGGAAGAVAGNLKGKGYW
jgi:osmotically inducible lipoprotein OsmB